MEASNLSNKNGIGFFDWVGFRKTPAYGNARWLGPIIGFAIALVVIALVVGGLATLIQFLSLVLSSSLDHEAIRNIGLAVIAVLGAPFVVWRAAVAQKQADTSEQSHITDQITKAVAGLGSEKTIDRIGRPVNVLCGKSSKVTHFVADPSSFKLPARSLERHRERTLQQFFDEENGDVDVVEGVDILVETWSAERTDIEWQGHALELEDGDEVSGRLDWTVFRETLPNTEVRIGSIYALERISQDSPRDHIRVMEILTAYIRENSPLIDLKPSEEPFYPDRPRTDIQAALDVIGRRSTDLVSLEHAQCYRLDFRKSELTGANFANGQLEGALLIGCRLEAANFRSANLKGARLQGSLLNFVEFRDANLCGAFIDRATITSLGPWQASVFAAKDTRGLSMAGTDMSAIQFIPTGKEHAPTFGTKDTTLAHHLDEKRQERTNDMNQFMYHSNGIDIDDEIGVKERLTNSGFLGWSPFDENDGATGSLRAKVWEQIGLVGFPYEDD